MPQSQVDDKMKIDALSIEARNEQILERDAKCAALKEEVERAQETYKVLPPLDPTTRSYSTPPLDPTPRSHSISLDPTPSHSIPLHPTPSHSIPLHPTPSHSTITLWPPV